MPRFILKSTIGDAILARNGEMHASLFFGPLGLEPRIYKTRAGAERGAAARSNRRVVELDQHGHEIEAARAIDITDILKVRLVHSQDGFTWEGTLAEAFARFDLNEDEQVEITGSLASTDRYSPEDGLWTLTVVRS